MGHHATPVLSLRMPCDPSAPAAIRRALYGLDWLGPSVDDVVTVACELVTNAVLHSGGAPSHTLHVQASLADRRMIIAVSDPGLSGQRARREVDGERQSGGWGLQIVEQLADRWGTERSGEHLVWAEVALQDASSVVRTSARADG